MVLKKELDIPIIEIADQNAKLDGGDVLFTGWWVFPSVYSSFAVSFKMY